MKKNTDINSILSLFPRLRHRGKMDSKMTVSNGLLLKTFSGLSHKSLSLLEPDLNGYRDIAHSLFGCRARFKRHWRKN